MAGGINLASKYSKIVDERWATDSQAHLVLNDNFEFKGNKTVNMYSIAIAPLTDYTRSGTSRYGTPNDLARNVQTMEVTQDKAFNYVIDKGDEVQSEYVCNPGSSLAREIREVIVPAFDIYCFGVMAQSAIDNGHYNTTAITASNAHEMLLKGVEHMCERNVPVENVYAFCTYSFGNLLMRDSSFIRYGDMAQKMLKTGQIGRADGIEIVMVAGNRLPAGAAFLLVHKDAVIAPRQLQEYKIHTDPPGISGTLCEGRALYDCFVLDEKSDGVYHHGGQAILKNLNFMTAATAAGKSTLIINARKEVSTNGWLYLTKATMADLPTPVYNTAIGITTSTSPWYGAAQVTSNEMEITPTSGHKAVVVVEVNSSMKPVSFNKKKLNVG